MRKINKFPKLFIFLLLVFIFICYRKMFSGFFQHDEWIAFGEMLSRKTDWVGVLTGFFAPDREHYIPICQIIFYAYLKLIKLNFSIYALLSIFLHLVVVVFVYLFSLKVFKKRGLALITCAFFGLSSSVHQATSMVFYDAPPHYSEIVALISLIYFWDFIKTEKIKKFYLSMIWLVISLFIKEVAFGFFLLYPITIVLFKDWHPKRQIKYFRLMVIGGILYLMLRLSMYFIPNANQTNATVFEMQTPANIVANMVLYPSKVFFQTVFPSRVNLIFSKWLTYLFPRSITGLPGTTQFDVFTEQTTLQILSFALFLLVIWGVYWLWRRGKDKIFVKYLIFGLLFIIINSFVYAFASGKSGFISYIDSRNLYMQSVGTAIFLVSLAAIVFKKRPSSIIIFILPFVLLHVVYLDKELTAISEMGAVRKSILFQIKREYPRLPPKVIFYTESDTSYYGMPETEKILPFELGLGRTLLVWYQIDENFPQIFFKRPFLWHPTSEGYVEEGDRGFGYFRKIELVRKVVKEKKLSLDSIFAYRFDSSDNSLTNVTSEIRDKLRN